MINKESFTESWILEVKGSERSDQAIIERQIYALHLLEELSNDFSDFIFKGGTSLSLISSEFPRFSVDIDILVSSEYKEFFTMDNLEKIVEHSEFVKVEENVRQPKHNIDKQHFEFYYDSIYGEDIYIILDVVYGESHYQDLKKVEVSNHLIKVDLPKVYVNIPSIHDLLSDKLCAYAPNTIGKKLGESRDVEVIKQMYDVSYLFRHYPRDPTFYLIYQEIAEHEIESRSLGISYKDTIRDTILTSLNIITEGKIDKKQYSALKAAIRRFTSFVRDFSFTIEDAKVCAIYNLYAGLLVLVKDDMSFQKIANEQKSYLDEYRVFVSTKRWLRSRDVELYDIFDNCLKVMSYLNVQI